jgi:hypothetical protein
VFPTNPPWIVKAKIYPFLGFDSPLEYLPESITKMATHYMHITGSLLDPLMGFIPLQHFSAKELPR